MEQQNTNNKKPAIHTNITSLPNELLLEIWSYGPTWDRVTPSIRKLHKEPSPRLTCSKETPMKFMSLVCKRWRQLILPELFKCARVKLGDEPRYLNLSRNLLAYIKHMPPFLDAFSKRASQHEKDVYQQLEQYSRKSSNNAQLQDPNIIFDLEYIEDDDQMFLAFPYEVRSWIPSARAPVRRFINFVQDNELQRKIHSLVVYTEEAYMEKASELMINKMNAEHDAFWTDIFIHLNPTRVVVAAPPTTMAAITDGKVHTEDAWAFEHSLHYLEFRQASPSTKDTPIFNPSNCDDSTCGKYHRCLHNARSWLSVSYNEGSSLPAYATYEYFWKRPSMIFYYILLWLHKEAKFALPRIRTVRYTAIFPTSTYINDIAEALSLLDSTHPLSHIELSFAPDPRSGILQDPERVGRADLSDCWSEFEKSYKAVIKKVGLNRTRPGLKITACDYESETLVGALDAKFNVLGPKGWLKEGCSWVLPGGSEEENEETYARMLSGLIYGVGMA